MNAPQSSEDLIVTTIHLDGKTVVCEWDYAVEQHFDAGQQRFYIRYTIGVVRPEQFSYSFYCYGPQRWEFPDQGTHGPVLDWLIEAVMFQRDVPPRETKIVSGF